MAVTRSVVQNNFNTSHVSVRLSLPSYVTSKLIFQYISCVGSMYLEVVSSAKRHISIHLMCRFDLSGTQYTLVGCMISIHLMCRFDLVRTPFNSLF